MDWQSELDAAPEEGEIDLGRPVYVASGSDRTLILVADGTTILTSDRLP